MKTASYPEKPVDAPYAAGHRIEPLVHLIQECNITITGRSNPCKEHLKDDDSYIRTSSLDYPHAAEIQIASLHCFRYFGRVTCSLLKSQRNSNLSIRLGLLFVVQIGLFSWSVSKVGFEKG